MEDNAQTEGQPAGDAGAVQPDVPAPADVTPPAEIAAGATPTADITPPDQVLAVPDLPVGAEAHVVDLVHSATFMPMLAVFVLAIFVGYYVVWHVTPALHSPLMAVTNAISSVIIVGALIAAGTAVDSFSTVLGFFGVILASVNIFGGFLVTRRMLSMYKKKVR